MSRVVQKVSLGISEDSLPVGTHMCLVFTEEEERVGSLLKVHPKMTVNGAVAQNPDFIESEEYPAQS